MRVTVTMIMIIIVQIYRPLFWWTHTISSITNLKKFDGPQASADNDPQQMKKKRKKKKKSFYNFFFSRVQPCNLSFLILKLINYNSFMFFDIVQELEKKKPPNVVSFYVVAHY